MNLEDVIDPEYGLQQDEFSLGRPRFGEYGQLEVIGWSGRSGGSKYYILKCSTCSQDTELYGEGLFKASRYNLLKPAIPCGCSRRPVLSGQQYMTIAQRYAPANIRILEYLGTKSNNAFFKLECTLCSSDAELFPNGWTNYMANLRKGQGVSCKCSVSPKFSYEQWTIVCSRVAEDRGLELIRIGPWAGSNNTPVFVRCACGGEVKVCSVDNFKNMLRDNYTCLDCTSGRRSLQMLKQRAESDIALKIREATTKPDNVMIDSFLASGQFPSGTKFWRSGRLNSCGTASYWHVYCPVCNYTGEATSGCLQKGSRPCECSPSRQKQAYINWLVDSSNTAISLKFGIANVASVRVRKQSTHCKYEVRNHSIWEFPSKKHCRDAENECKRQLECRVLSREDMPDGWTETTHVYSLGRIKDIYAKHGGVQCENVTPS